MEKLVIVVTEDVDLLLGIDGLDYIPRLAANKLDLLVVQRQADVILVTKGVHDFELRFSLKKQLQGRATQVINSALDILANHGVEPNKLNEVGSALQREFLSGQPDVVEVGVLLSNRKDAFVDRVIDQRNQFRQSLVVLFQRRNKLFPFINVIFLVVFNLRS